MDSFQEKYEYDKFVIETAHKIQSPSLEYRSIRFLGTYGDQFPRYFPECVAQLPLSGNDQIVVGSSLKLFGCKLISHAPFSFPLAEVF